MVDEQLSGREMDLVIAERLMGFRWFHCVAGTGVERNQFCSKDQEETWRGVGWRMTEIPTPPPPDQFNDSSGTPLYSESIEAAMQVVEKMERRVDIQFFPANTPQWCVIFISRNGGVAWSTTLPEAICLAALRVIERPT